jgi:hypothetical protein
MTVEPSTLARIRSALDRHASQEMSFGGHVLHQVEPTSAQHSRVWSAQLDTLFEERYLRRVVRAAPSDAPERTPTLTGTVDPWSLELDLALELADTSTEVDIAGTEQTKTCTVCSGESKTRCPECGGEGTLGYRRPCLSCHGTGLSTCDACGGQGRLVELQVVEVLRRHDAQTLVDRGAPVPAEVMAQATRDELLHLDIPRMDVATYDATTGAYRGRGPSDPEFEGQVRDLVAGKEATPPARIVRQRLVVRYVPVVEVEYDWRGDPGKLWLVGTEERVFGRDMPLKGAFVSRTVSAARKRFEGWFGKGRRSV